MISPPGLPPPERKLYPSSSAVKLLQRDRIAFTGACLFKSSRGGFNHIYGISYILAEPERTHAVKQAAEPSPCVDKAHVYGKFHPAGMDRAAGFNQHARAARQRFAAEKTLQAGAEAIRHGGMLKDYRLPGFVHHSHMCGHIGLDFSLQDVNSAFILQRHFTGRLEVFKQEISRFKLEAVEKPPAGVNFTVNLDYPGRGARDHFFH